ncbi:hypothetical protein J4734_09310 [Klebsiella pneumoniae]|uniref:Uncharacterized protein n=1 Tax=Klebsiella pneumoniae TaxID=573 RepID=A0A939SUH2_KLEPN|nr:hypothetical protein [Klebsiella pneumoniae]
MSIFDAPSRCSPSAHFLQTESGTPDWINQLAQCAGGRKRKSSSPLFQPGAPCVIVIHPHFLTAGVSVPSGRCFAVV